MLEIHNLKKSFFSPDGWKIALESVRLVVNPGSTLTLLGPNGSGKTTLLKIVAGLISPDEGYVRITTQNQALSPERAKQLIGYAPAESKSFYSRLSGIENLRFFAGLRGISEPLFQKRLADFSGLFHLEEFLKQPTQELSAGCRQQLSLVRALLHEPRILLLDEPTQFLDPETGKKFTEYLRREFSASSGRIVLWATHNIDEAWKGASETAILRKGRLTAVASPNELSRRTGNTEPEDAYLELTRGIPA